MPGTSRDRPGIWVLLAVLCLLLTSFAAYAATSGSGPAAVGTPTAGLGAAAITVGNSAAEACSDADTCTTPAVAGVDAGDALVVVVTNHNGFGGNPSSVEEVYSGGNTALTRLAGSACNGMEHGSVSVYGLANAAAQTSVTFTVDYTGDQYYTVHALDVHGAAPTPFETAGTPVCSTAAGTEASASVTTTLANDLVILGVEVRADEAISATGGDTLVTSEEITGTNANSGAMLDESDTGTGSFTLSATFTSAQYAALAVAVKPSLPLTAGAVSPATATVDSGQTLALTSTAASSGSGTYAYQWYAGSATCGAGSAINGATSLAYTTPALTTGPDYYCVDDTDSETGESAYTNVAEVTVSAALTVHITPSAPDIDQGQSVTLTATPAGGTGTDTYRWYADGGCTGTVQGTSAVLATGDLTSSQTYCVSVTDSAYVPVTVMATDAVTVSASGLSAAITPSAPSVDTGQSVNLTAEPSGGTGPYSYAWYAGTTCGVGSVLATTQLYTTAALTSDQSYCVSVTDSSYEPASVSATVTVTVGSASLSAVILPVSPGVDSGQSIVLTASPSGGTGPYTYVWHEYSGSCSGASLGTSQSLTTPDLTSTTEYCVVVTDSSAEPEVYTATDTVAVSPVLSAAIAPAGPHLDSGQDLLLTAEPSGGTGTDAFSWYLGGSCTGTILSSTTTYQTPSLASTTTYCVSVTDSAHSPVTVTATDTITVSSAALSASVDPNSPAIDPGQDVVLTATPAGGTAPDSYAWYAGLTCTGSVLGNAAVFTTPSLTSTTSYCVLVTDASYEPVQASATATVTVSSAVLSVSISPESPNLDLGQSISLTAAPVGGTAPDSVAWYEGSSCTGTVLATTLVLATPDLSTTTSYCVAVTDSSSEPATATATDTVAVSSASLSAAILPQAPSIDFGQSITLTADASGGTSPDSYAWYSGSVCAGLVLATTPAYATPVLSSSTTYCVAVTDNATDPVTVNATDGVTVSASALSVAVGPQAPSIDNGQSITLTASASGGTGSDSYAWYSGTDCSGTAVGSGPTFRTPALTSTTTYCVAATDAAYSPATATATDTVTASAAALTLAVSPATPSVTSGQSITLTATAAGGTGADSFAWYADAGCTGTVVGTSASFTTPVLTAAAEFCVTATDSSSVPATVSASASVSVTAATPPPSSPGKAPSPSFLSSDWWIIPVALVVVLLLVLVVARRRRSNPAMSPSNAGLTGAPPASGGGLAFAGSGIEGSPPPAMPAAGPGTMAAESSTSEAGPVVPESVPAVAFLGTAVAAPTPEDPDEVPSVGAPSVPQESPSSILYPTDAVPAAVQAESPSSSPSTVPADPASAATVGPAVAEDVPGVTSPPPETPVPAPIEAPVSAAAPATDQPVLPQVEPATNPPPVSGDAAANPAVEVLPAESLSASPPVVDLPSESAQSPVTPPTAPVGSDLAPGAASSLSEPEPVLGPASVEAPAELPLPGLPEVAVPAAQSSVAPEGLPEADGPAPTLEAPPAILGEGIPPVSDAPQVRSGEPASPVPPEVPGSSPPVETPGAAPGFEVVNPVPTAGQSAPVAPDDGPAVAGPDSGVPVQPEPLVPEPTPIAAAELPIVSAEPAGATVSNWEVPVAPGAEEALSRPATPEPPASQEAPAPLSEAAPPETDGPAPSSPIALGPGPDLPATPASPNDTTEGLPPARRAVLAGWLFKNQSPESETKE